MDKNRGPYGLEIIKNCLTCPVREDNIFCRLQPAALADLNAIRQNSVYPRSSVLFVEGQPAGGLHLLCSGKAKLTTSSPQGRSLIIRVAERGEVLGLSAVMSDSSYEATAETLEPSEVAFLPRADFLRFMQTHGDVGLRVAQHLSMELRRAYDQVARIALAPTVRAKLVGLLLEWSGANAQPALNAHFNLQFTQEEIGEILGCSRETVARLLGDLRRAGLIQVKGASVTIPDAGKLKAILA